MFYNVFTVKFILQYQNQGFKVKKKQHYFLFSLIFFLIL